MIFERLAKLLSEQFGLEAEDITEDTGFEELGADSVDLVELSMNLEEEFGVEEMGEEDITSIHNVGDLVNYLQKKLGE
jgi:acyl carrier protein